MYTRFPSFPDLGKDCRDLFTYGYHVGFVRVDVRNETCHGIEVKANGTHTIEDKTANAGVEVRSCWPANGVTTVSRWDTGNNLSNDLIYSNFIPGARMTLASRANIDTGLKGGALRGNYTHCKFTLDTNAEAADDSNLLVGASIVGGMEGVFGAVKVDFDTDAGEVKTTNLGAGYMKKDYNFMIAYDNLTILKGFYFHRVRPDVEIGAMSTITGADEAPLLGVAAKYVFSGYGHTLRAKVNSKSIFGLGLALKIVEGFTASASADIDLKNFAKGPHKVGFGMDFGNC